jgi:branched-chain amino acid transport system permease protein
MENLVRHIRSSLGLAFWFVFLSLPFMVVRVNTLKNVVEWRWMNMVWVGLAVFLLTFAWKFGCGWYARRRLTLSIDEEGGQVGLWVRLFEERRLYGPILIVIGLSALLFPWLVNTYQVNIMVWALIFVVLGLGLNITVGLAGLLDLGYIAFFAVGAYTYAILNTQFGLGFWASLPLGGLAGALFGVLLGFPILRLRGDYLAIVTLGFGSIAKIVFENWEGVFNGAKGIVGIDRPGLFGMDMSLAGVTTYTFYLMLVMVVFTIFITNRLKDSRIGRAWMALREDEIACVAMGIDMARTKLSAYAFGAFWAGLVGVFAAARNTVVYPNSFTFMESVIVLSIVVLGGMGSIVGVIVAALLFILIPEYLQDVSVYRWLVFGALMVVTMIFRPQGLVANMKRTYRSKAIDRTRREGTS